MVTNGKLYVVVMEKLNFEPRFDASKVRVTVLGRTVTLDGEVGSFDEKGIAENVAWSIPGVVDVRNNLEII